MLALIAIAVFVSAMVIDFAETRYVLAVDRGAARDAAMVGLDVQRRVFRFRRCSERLVVADDTRGDGALLRHTPSASASRCIK